MLERGSGSEAGTCEFGDPLIVRIGLQLRSLQLREFAPVLGEARHLRAALNRHIGELLRDFGAPLQIQLFLIRTMQTVQNRASLDPVAILGDYRLYLARLRRIELHRTHRLDSRAHRQLVPELAGRNRRQLRHLYHRK